MKDKHLTHITLTVSGGPPAKSLGLISPEPLEWTWKFLFSNVSGSFHRIFLNYYWKSNFSSFFILLWGSFKQFSIQLEKYVQPKRFWFFFFNLLIDNSGTSFLDRIVMHSWKFFPFISLSIFGSFTQNCFFWVWKSTS